MKTENMNKIWAGVFVAVMIVGAAVPMIVSAEQEDPWFLYYGDWAYRKQIVVNHTKVQAGLTDFPVLISNISGDFAAHAQPDGDDFVFTTEAGGKLNHEIEWYDHVTGKLVAWVKVPFVSSTEDTVIELYYGNPNCANQQNPEGTWNSHFKAVWHLNNNPTGTIYDSTSNNNDGATSGMNSANRVDGRVGKCFDFDGSNDDVLVPDSASLRPTEVTLLCWLCPESDTDTSWWHLGKGCQDEFDNQDAVSYGIRFDKVGRSFYHDMGTYAETDHNSFTYAKYDASLNNWYYAAMTYDSTSKNIRYYQNGVLRDTKNHGQSLRYTAPWGFVMGAGHKGGGKDINYYVDCKIDEVWVVDMDLSSEWIQTTYQNQNNPSTFVVISDEQEPDVDSDNDGWPDVDEIYKYFTNPHDPDTDHDGVNDPQDVDPLIDLQLTLQTKRIYASDYTYTWREGESWDRSEGKSSSNHNFPIVVSNMSIEAENVGNTSVSTSTSQTQINSFSVGGPWEIFSDPAASNSLCTRQDNREGVNDWAEWDFTVNKAGVYQVWIRSHRYKDGCSNVWPTWNGESFFVKKWDDGGLAYDLCWYQPNTTGDLWRWTWYGAVYMEEEPGTLRLENRHEDLAHPRDGNPEDYIEVDNILITDDPSCVPTGNGVEGRDTHEIGYATNYEFDAGSPPDFYIRTYIGSVERISPVWYDDYNVLDDWSTTVNVPDDDANVSLTIELWDEDGASDQLCDISPIGQTCNLIYNLRSGTWTGDDSVNDIDFIGRTCGEVSGEWNYDVDVIFEINQNDFDGDDITYWQEILGPYNGSISPLIRNDRYAVIVGAGASCKLMQNSDIGSYIYPYKGTYLRYDQGDSWTDYTVYVDLMTNDDIEPDHEDIGMMFRYQDANNYYLLRWEQNGDNDRMLLWKFVNGICTEIASPQYTDLTKNQWYTLKIVVSGNQIEVLKNTNLPIYGGAEAWTYIFNIQDSSLSHGSIALFTWKNRGAWFDDILVKKSNGDILLSEDFNYGEIDKWTVVDEASGFSDWKLTDLSVDQEDFYIAPDYLYRVLRLGAHYKPSNIRYLNADKYRDADGDGVNDVSGVSMKASIQYLLNEWIRSSSDANDLNLIYIFDHGMYTEEDGSFVTVDNDRDGYVGDSVLIPESLPVDTEYKLCDYEVDEWLPYYGIDGIGRLTFVVEACYIGHFIDVLSHPGESRIIIPSTTYTTSASGETGSDWPAFSYNFFKEMTTGTTNFMDAFNEAYYKVKDNFLSMQCGQDPKLDDNGELPGHDQLPNGGDGNLAHITGL